jgi:hypothetical protein
MEHTPRSSSSMSSVPRLALAGAALAGLGRGGGGGHVVGAWAGARVWGRQAARAAQAGCSLAAAAGACCGRRPPRGLTRWRATAGAARARRAPPRRRALAPHVGRRAARRGAPRAPPAMAAPAAWRLRFRMRCSAQLAGARALSHARWPAAPSVSAGRPGWAPRDAPGQLAAPGVRAQLPGPWERGVRRLGRGPTARARAPGRRGGRRWWWRAEIEWRAAPAGARFGLHGAPRRAVRRRSWHRAHRRGAPPCPAPAAGASPPAAARIATHAACRGASAGCRALWPRLTGPRALPLRAPPTGRPQPRAMSMPRAPPITQVGSPRATLHPRQSTQDRSGIVTGGEPAGTGAGPAAVGDGAGARSNGSAARARGASECGGVSVGGVSIVRSGQWPGAGQLLAPRAMHMKEGRGSATGARLERGRQRRVTRTAP